MSDKQQLTDAAAEAVKKLTPRLEPGDNPREALGNHKERGPKRFYYTYEDIARICGLASSTVRWVRSHSSCKAG